MEQRIFSDILIKFFEQEQWADDFLSGKLYINQAGKFITEENNFRGDDCEGCQVVSFEKPILIQFTRTDNGETVKIPLLPQTPIKQSFIGAEKVPVLCASGLNSNNIEKLEDNKYRINSEYMEYMKQFGTHAVIFSRKELLDKLNSVLKVKKIPAISGDMCYQEYDTSIKTFATAKEQYEQFFYKYVSKNRDYKKQNEWRLILCDTALIDKDNDHIVIDIGALKYAAKANVENFIEAIMTFHEEAEAG